MARVSKEGLLEVLRAFDEMSTRKLTLIAVGGTALTLLGIKASTKDINFNIPSHDDYVEFKRLYARITPGVQIDFWGSNMIFSEVLPKDYIKHASSYRSSFKNLVIKILAPLDIACSKISRFDEADREDIKECVDKCKIMKPSLRKRALEYSRAGSDDVFKTNLEYILQNMF